jgi:hypothetical protein
MLRFLNCLNSIAAFPMKLRSGLSLGGVTPEIAPNAFRIPNQLTHRYNGNQEIQDPYIN